MSSESTEDKMFLFRWILSGKFPILPRLLGSWWGCRWKSKLVTTQLTINSKQLTHSAPNVNHHVFWGTGAVQGAWKTNSIRECVKWEICAFRWALTMQWTCLLRRVDLLADLDLPIWQCNTDDLDLVGNATQSTSLETIGKHSFYCLSLT